MRQDEEQQKQLELTPEERSNLVGAFVWLIEQDKKQNPALYKRNKQQNDRHSMSSNS